MSVLIKNAENSPPVYVEGREIKAIGKAAGVEAEHVLDARGKALLPGLVNTHTHTGMALLRGYADDLELHEWLEKHVWPAETKYGNKEYYVGSLLACLEMIKTGTTTFVDMYYQEWHTARACEELGVRGVLASAFLDFGKNETREKFKKDARELFSKTKKAAKEGFVVPAIGPHAVYTVSSEGLEWCRDFARDKDCLLHIHLSETRKENEDCLKEKGKRPTEYLDELGVLNENTLAAHCVWVTKGEVKTLADKGVKVSHCPASNMKLATGGTMPYKELVGAGVTVSLGTDSVSSNNNLDMFESMKFAALLQKAHRWDQTVLPAGEAWEMATVNGAKALGLNAGKIREGALADLILVDLRRPEMTPNHDLTSNLVYSANGSCVTDVICNGRVVMRDGKVPGEENILEKAEKVAKKLGEG